MQDFVHQQYCRVAAGSSKPSFAEQGFFLALHGVAV